MTRFCVTARDVVVVDKSREFASDHNNELRMFGNRLRSSQPRAAVETEPMLDDARLRDLDRKSCEYFSDVRLAFGNGQSGRGLCG